MVRIHYELPDELHARAKQAAAKERMTLRAFLEDALSRRADEVLGPERRKG